MTGTRGTPESVVDGETSTPIGGFVDPGFAGVREAFAANFREHGEVGAAVAVRVDGRVVADLHGGVADPTTGRPWRSDTLVNAFSVGKGVLAALVLVLVERGDVELDRPICECWPEFATAEKDAITLRMLLSHRAGLPAIREMLPDGAWRDWDGVCAALAATRPWWEPDSAHGYHVNMYGFLVGEALHRATGRRVEDLLREHISGPLGVDFHYGLPDAQHPRVARTGMPDVHLTTQEHFEKAFPPTGDGAFDLMIWRAYFNPPGASGAGTVNTAAWRSSVNPSTSGTGDARSVAAIYAGLLARRGGPDLGVGASVLADGLRIHSDGHDRVLDRPSRFGLGFQISSENRPLGRGERGFGHYGYGGSLGFADPEAAIAFGYVTNQPGARWKSPRTDGLIDALYGCL